MNWKTIGFFGFFMLMTLGVAILVRMQYLNQFGEDVLRTGTQEQWGQYGDYMGGLLNPILTILNICLLIYMSVNTTIIDERRTKEAAASEQTRIKEISDLEDKRNQSMIETQKMITLNKMRYQQANELVTLLDSVILDNLDNAQTKERLNSINVYLTTFSSQNKYLFEKLYEDNFKEDFIAPYIEVSKQLQESIKAEMKKTTAGPIDPEKRKLYTSLIVKKALLIQRLNEFIISELTTK